MAERKPKRQRYRITGEVTISIQTVVEASSEAEARELADEQAMQTFCGQCADGCDDEWSTTGELDGTPRILTVELEDS